MVHKEQPQAVPPQKAEHGAQRAVCIQLPAQLAEDPDAAHADGGAENEIDVSTGSKLNVNALLATPGPRHQHGKKQRYAEPVQQRLLLVEQLAQGQVHDHHHGDIQALRQILHLPNVSAEQHHNKADDKISFGE